jgi:methionyl-tRNA formyltransferase
VKLAVAATAPFGADVLEGLARRGHDIELLLTRPDRPQGRGRKEAPPPAKAVAERLGIRVAQPQRLIEYPGAAAVVVIVAYGVLIPDNLLGERLWLNVHPSLLPRWRGAAPVERAIEAGDDVTGVTIMRPTPELDAGPICLQAEEPILPDDDYGTLAPRLERLGGELLVRSLDERPPFRDQPAAGVTFAAKIGPEDRRLDPGLPAAAMERRVRALNPHIGAFIEEPRMGVRRARGSVESVPAGELAASDGRLLYGAADGALELLEVVPAGSRPMDAAAYLRGRGRR